FTAGAGASLSHPSLSYNGTIQLFRTPPTEHTIAHAVIKRVHCDDRFGLMMDELMSFASRSFSSFAQKQRRSCSSSKNKSKKMILATNRTVMKVKGISSDQSICK